MHTPSDSTPLPRAHASEQLLQALADQEVKFTLVIQHPNMETKLFSSEVVSEQQLNALKAIFNPMNTRHPHTPTPSPPSSFTSPQVFCNHDTESSHIVSSPFNNHNSSRVSEHEPFKKVQHTPTMTLDLSDYENVKCHLIRCFKELQQLPCKSIAKQWIRKFEPKKQTHHPYRDGDSSKPRWWPVSVRHVEPDHLRKAERLELLVSLALNQRADLIKFRESTRDITNLDDHKHAVLNEIYYVAKSYNNRMTLGNSIIEVSDFSANRALKRSKKLKAVTHTSRKKPRTSEDTESSYIFTKNDIHTPLQQTSLSPVTASNFLAESTFSMIHTQQVSDMGSGFRTHSDYDYLTQGILMLGEEANELSESSSSRKLLPAFDPFRVDKRRLEDLNDYYY